MPGDQQAEDSKHLAGKKRPAEDVKDQQGAKEFFVKAVECGFLANVKAVFEDGSIDDVSSMTHHGNPNLAACVTSKEVTEYLVSKGAQVNGAVVRAVFGCQTMVGR